jgi:hypothetical protein
MTGRRRVFQAVNQERRPVVRPHGARPEKRNYEDEAEEDLGSH